jgi:hypothetical protein
MKKLLLLSIFLLLLFSCKKETLTNNIEGNWYFIEAYETDKFDDEYDLLIDYENITVTFKRNEIFIWWQNDVGYSGTYDIDLNKLTFSFDNGDKEVWKNYNLKRKQNTLSYSNYNNDDSRFKFKIKKITTNYSRR